MTAEEASQRYVALRQQRDAGRCPTPNIDKWWRNWR